VVENVDVLIIENLEYIIVDIIASENDYYIYLYQEDMRELKVGKKEEQSATELVLIEEPKELSFALELYEKKNNIIEETN